jgi:hypothetical protein
VNRVAVSSPFFLFLLCVWSGDSKTEIFVATSANGDGQTTLEGSCALPSDSREFLLFLYPWKERWDAGWSHCVVEMVHTDAEDGVWIVCSLRLGMIGAGMGMNSQCVELPDGVLVLQATGYMAPAPRLKQY